MAPRTAAERWMRFSPQDRFVDVAVAVSLAILPLMPAGFSYVGSPRPGALDTYFFLLLAAGVLLLPLYRPAAGATRVGAPRSTRIVRRGYTVWLITAAAATVIGLLERLPFDPALLRFEAAAAWTRLFQPMNQVGDPWYALRVGFTCLQGGILFWWLSALLHRTRNPERRARTAMAGVLIGTAMVSAIAIYQYAAGANLHPYWVRVNPHLTRSHSTLDDPNALASFLVLGIGLAAGAAWADHRPRTRLVLGLAAALGGAALWTTVSRAGLAALLLAAVLLAAFLPDRTIGTHALARTLQRGSRAIGGCLIGALLIWALARAALPDQLAAEPPNTPLAAVWQTIDPRQPLDSVLKGRYELWAASLELARRHPALGGGSGQLPRFVASFPGTDGPENAHNYFLQVLAEGGAIGLAGLLVLLASIAAAVREPIRHGDVPRARLAIGLAGGVLAFVLTWLTGHPMLTSSNQLWLAVVLAVGLAAADGGRGSRVTDPPGPAGRTRAIWFHPAFIPLTAAIVLFAAVPRAAALVQERERESHAAGVYAWETAPPISATDHDTRFRWTAGHAVLHEPVGGSTIVLPIYLARPDLPDQEVTVEIRVNGTSAGVPVIFGRNGWHLLSYDLARVLGEPLPAAVTLELRIAPTVVPAELGGSDDRRELGVGVGAVRWRQP